MRQADAFDSTPHRENLSRIVSRAFRLAELAGRGAGRGPPRDGQDTRALQAYLGHRCIQHTVRYTELSPERFQRFWRD